MKLFSSANIADLRTLYISAASRKLSSMEQKITDALPKMIEKSTDPDLTSAFQTHLQETRGHVAKAESLLRKAIGGEASTDGLQSHQRPHHRSQRHHQGRHRSWHPKHRLGRRSPASRASRDRRPWNPSALGPTSQETHRTLLSWSPSSKKKRTRTISSAASPTS